MIHIRLHFDSLWIEIEIRGVPNIANERFYIPMELIRTNLVLNEAYMAFRNLGHGTLDHSRMAGTLYNRTAMQHLRDLAFEAQAASRHGFAQSNTQRIARASVLA